VAEVYPDLVAHSADGQIETVKYQILDSMVLNEVQRQEKTIAEQKSAITALEERLARLENLIASGPR
jgi:polyhydroxyalkanoate synthesis regulator phasin